MNHILTDPDRWRAACRKNFALADDAPVGIIAPRLKDLRVETEGNKRDVTFVANTDDIDLDDEVVVPAGADKSHIERNGQAFADHQYDIASAVGAIRSTKMAGGRWLQRVFVYDKPGNRALCEDILYMAGLGKIGASIGFVALDWGPPTRDEEKAYATKEGRAPSSIVRAWKWLETSFTAMPCNVACQSVGGAQVDGRAIGDLDELVTKGKIRRASAVALGLPESPKRRYHSTGPQKRVVVV